MQIYLTIGRFSLLYRYYLFFDSDDHKAYRLFEKYGIRWWKDEERRKDGESYVLMICRIPRWYADQFELAMSEMCSHMIILGYTDYEEYCRKWFDQFFEMKEGGGMKRFGSLSDQCQQCEYLSIGAERTDGDHYYSCKRHLLLEANRNCDKYELRQGTKKEF